MADEQNIVATASPASSIGPSQATAPSYVIGPTSAYLFGRTWRLSIGTYDEKSARFTLPPFAYTSLRMTFDIEKTSISTANKAKIGVYNFNDISRKQYVKGLVISLDAGYALASNIFTGNVSGSVRTERKGPDLLTTFECGEGERALTTATATASWPAGFPILKVVNDLSLFMRLPLGCVSPALSGMVTKGALAVSGSVKTALDTILSGLKTPATPKGFGWSVQNGAIQISPIGVPTGLIAVVVSAATGLIGVPSDGAGGDNIVRFTSLLNPRLVPGALVSLQSRLVVGVYEVKNAHYEGDTHGSKWQVSCECIPTSNIR